MKTQKFVKQKIELTKSDFQFVKPRLIINKLIDIFVKQFCLLEIKTDQSDSTEPTLAKPDPIDRTRPKLTHSPH